MPIKFKEGEPPYFTITGEEIYKHLRILEGIRRTAKVPGGYKLLTCDILFKHACKIELDLAELLEKKDIGEINLVPRIFMKHGVECHGFNVLGWITLCQIQKQDEWETMRSIEKSKKL